MAITSGFFDSVNSDRLYNAEQMSHYFDGLITNGVYESVGDRLVVSSAESGMSVTVGSGRAIIRCHWFYNSEETTVQLDPSDSVGDRLDVIALRLDTEARSISLVVKKGTPKTSASYSGRPVMPPIIRTDTVYELYLATVYISKGATSVGQITDYRSSSYCGWVTGLIKQVDTSDLFTQFELAYEQMYDEFRAYMDEKEQAFNVWFETLTQELTVEAGFIKLENRADLPAGVSGTMHIPIGIEEYDPETDALMVYLGGKFQTEGVDYTQETNPTTHTAGIAITINPALTETTRLNFVVFKNQIGQSVIEPVTESNPAAIGFEQSEVGTATSTPFDD